MGKIHLVTFKADDQRGNKTKLDKHLEKHAVKGKKVKMKKELKHIPRVFIIEDADDETIADLLNDPDVLAVEEPVVDYPFMAQTTEWSHGAKFIDVAQFRSRGATGAGVKVGIIDTGFANHQDLVYAGRYNAYTAVRGGTTPPEADKHGHGTKVAGIIGARNNTLGYVGVAPDVLLYGAKADDNSGSGGMPTDAQIEAIDWLMSQGVHIINCSFGQTGIDDLARKAAFQTAYNSGILIICAAGNERDRASDPNNSVAYPAKYDFVMAVAALKANKQPAPYSSRGPEVDIAAPADPVMTTAPSAANQAGTDYTTPSTQYSSFNGTSCAAPHVTGVAALYKQLYPTATADELRTLMELYAEDLGKDGKDPDFGYGMVTSIWTTHADYPGKRLSNAITMSGNSISDSISSGLGKFFKFVPSSSGRYIITTSSSLDLYARLYDANFNQIAQDDDSAGGSQPKLEADLVAGQTYYIMVCGYSGSQTGSFTINASNIGQVIKEDFEDTTYVIPFTTVGSWIRTALVGNKSTYGYRAYNVADGGYAQLSFKVTVPSGKTAQLSFYQATATELDRDFLTLTVNGVELMRKSGSQSSMQTFTLNAGVNTLVFKYQRDANPNSGGNYIVLDDIQIVGDGVTVSAG